MKVIILGSRGYLGSNLVTEFENIGSIVLGTDRSTLSFGEGNELAQLRKLIEDFSPDVIVNALGKIDTQEASTPLDIFNSIFLPTFLLYSYFCEKNPAHKVSLLTFGSESEGEPRKNYPVYSAIKTAEATLVKTAVEVFLNTNVSWQRLTIPRLNGGLGKVGNQPDSHLERKSIEEVWAEVLITLNIRENPGE